MNGNWTAKNTNDEASLSLRTCVSESPMPYARHFSLTFVFWTPQIHTFFYSTIIFFVFFIFSVSYHFFQFLVLVFFSVALTLRSHDNGTNTSQEWWQSKVQGFQNENKTSLFCEINRCLQPFVDDTRESSSTVYRKKKVVEKSDRKRWSLFLWLEDQTLTISE